jgi:hypothetical protein
MFGLAVVRREKIGDSSLTKFESQSIPMIAIGRCQQSNGLQFNNTLLSTFVSSIDYKFQSNVTSGARFGFRNQPGTFIYRLDETNQILTPEFSLESEVLMHTHSPPHRAKVIGLPSYDRPNVYTVIFSDGSISEYSDENNILTLAPVPQSNEKSILLPSWIQDGTNATVFLTSMTRPRHGKLRLDPSDQWIFTPVIQLIYPKEYCCMIFLLIFNSSWTPGNYLRGIQNFV